MESPLSTHRHSSCLRLKLWSLCLLVLIQLQAPLWSVTLTYDDDGNSSNGITDGATVGWDTSSSVWFLNNSTADTIWPNTNADIAAFGGGTTGTAGTITVGTVTANGIIFNTPAAGSYTLSGGTINLSGTTPTITANTNATIASIIAGTAITKSGSGTLTLTGNNTFTSIVIKGGLVAITAEGTNTGGQLGVVPAAASANNITLDGGGLAFTSTTAAMTLSANRGIVITSNGGTLSNNSTQTNFVSGAITDAGGTPGVLTINGTGGTLAFNNANSTYSGGTILSGSVVVVPVVSSTSVGGVVTKGPFGTGTITFNGAQIRATSSGNMTIGNNLILANNVTLPSAGNSNTLTFTGSVLLTGTRSITNSQGGAIIFTGAITDGGQGFGLTKGGSSTMIVSGANTYSGTTTVSAGTLQAGAANTLSANSAVSVGNAAGAILDLNNFSQTIASLAGGGTTGGTVTLGTATLTAGGNNTSTAYSGVISGTGNFAKVGAGTLTLAGLNTYSGTTTVSGGNLTLSFATNNSGILGSSTGLVLNGGSITLTGKASAVDSQTVNGLTIASGNAVITLNANTATSLVLNVGNITQTGGTVNFVLPTGTQSATNGITTTNATGLLGGWATVTGSSGTDLAYVSGGNIVGYSTAATYTAINRLGGVIPNSAATDGQIAEAGTSGNITLANTGGVTTINTLRQSSTAGTATIDPGTGEILRLGAAGEILVDSGASSLVIGTTANDGKLTAGGADNTAGTLLVINNSANTTTINSTIVDNGSGVVSLHKSGTGSVTLGSTSNTYTGKTLVDGGILNIAGDGSLGAVPGAADASNITLMSGATLQWGAAATLNSNRGIVLGAGGGKLDSQTFAATVAGVISGDGSLTVTNTAGSLTLSGANTYTGATAVNGATLLIAANNSALGTTLGATTVASGSVLQLADGITITGETVNLNGTAQNIGVTTSRGALQVAVNGTATWAGSVVLQSNSRVGTQEGGKLTITGPISGAFVLQVSASSSSASKTTSYVQLTSTNNTYTGQTQLIRGTLRLGATNTLPTGTTIDVHQAGTNTTEYAGMDMAGFSQTIAGLQSSGVSSSTTASNNALIFNSSATQSVLTDNQSATTEFGGLISDNISLVKAGTGALTLFSTSAGAGVNTYTGTTTISGGTLQVGKTGLGTTGTGAVSVNGTGAVLAGTGTIQGATTVTVGTISPGDSAGIGAGTLKFSNGVTFGSSTNAALNVNTAGTADKIQITGSLTLNSSANFQLTFDAGYTPTLGTSWNLMDWTGLLTTNGFSTGASGVGRTGAAGNEGNLDLPDLTSINSTYYYLVTQLTDGSTGGAVVVTVVPEPGRALLIGVGLFGLVLRRRRKMVQLH